MDIRTRRQGHRQQQQPQTPQGRAEGRVQFILGGGVGGCLLADRTLAVAGTGRRRVGCSACGGFILGRRKRRGLAAAKDAVPERLARPVLTLKRQLTLAAGLPLRLSCSGTAMVSASRAVALPVSALSPLLAALCRQACSALFRASAAGAAAPAGAIVADQARPRPRAVRSGKRGDGRPIELRRESGEGWLIRQPWTPLLPPARSPAPVSQRSESGRPGSPAADPPPQRWW